MFKFKFIILPMISMFNGICEEWPSTAEGTLISISIIENLSKAAATNGNAEEGLSYFKAHFDFFHEYTRSYFEHIDKKYAGDTNSASKIREEKEEYLNKYYRPSIKGSYFEFIICGTAKVMKLEHIIRRETPAQMCHEFYKITREAHMKQIQNEEQKANDILEAITKASKVKGTDYYVRVSPFFISFNKEAPSYPFIEKANTRVKITPQLKNGLLRQEIFAYIFDCLAIFEEQANIWNKTNSSVVPSPNIKDKVKEYFPQFSAQMDLLLLFDYDEIDNNTLYKYAISLENAVNMLAELLDDTKIKSINSSYACKFRENIYGVNAFNNSQEETLRNRQELDRRMDELNKSVVKLNNFKFINDETSSVSNEEGEFRKIQKAYEEHEVRMKEHTKKFIGGINALNQQIINSNAVAKDEKDPKLLIALAGIGAVFLLFIILHGICSLFSDEPSQTTTVSPNVAPSSASYMTYGPIVEYQPA